MYCRTSKSQYALFSIKLLEPMKFFFNSELHFCGRVLITGVSQDVTGEGTR